MSLEKLEPQDAKTHPMRDGMERLQRQLDDARAALRSIANDKTTYFLDPQESEAAFYHRHIRTLRFVAERALLHPSTEQARDPYDVSRSNTPDDGRAVGRLEAIRANTEQADG